MLKKSVLTLAALVVVIVVFSRVADERQGPVHKPGIRPDNNEFRRAPSVSNTLKPTVTDREVSAGEAQQTAAVRGVLIDGQNATVTAGDILYKFVPTQSAGCDEGVEPDFDLDPSTMMIQSDDRGQFEIPLSEQAKRAAHCLVLHASKSGYASTVANLDLRMQADLVEVELQKHKNLRGKVTTPDGRAVDGAEIKSWIAEGGQVANREMSLCGDVDEDSLTKGITGDDGLFEIGVAGDNLFCLQASHSDWASSAAQTVDLSAANPATPVLALESPLTVSGRVTDQDGRAVSDLILHLIRKNDSEPAIASSDADGQFIFRKVEPASYHLSTGNPAFAVATPKEIVVRHGQPANEIEVSVYPLSTITGRVVDPAGQPVSDVRVSTRSPYLPDLSISVATTNGDGYFEVRSEHRSKVVRDMLRMANEFREGGRPPLDSGNSPVSCLSFYHPQFRSDERSLVVSEANHDVGTIHLQHPVWEFAGMVTNHRGEGIEAQLSFKLIDDKRNASSAPPSRCDHSSAPRQVQTDDHGRFTLHIDSPGRFEVDIETARYKPRRQNVDLSQPGTFIELNLN
jgi:protocatechuate 3,4-dioxygenase beta subunit